MCHRFKPERFPALRLRVAPTACVLSHFTVFRPNPVLLPESFRNPLRRRFRAVSPGSIIRCHSQEKCTTLALRLSRKNIDFPRNYGVSFSGVGLRLTRPAPPGAGCAAGDGEARCNAQSEQTVRKEKDDAKPLLRGGFASSYMQISRQAEAVCGRKIRLSLLPFCGF